MKNIKIINVSPAAAAAKSYKFPNPNSCSNLLTKSTIVPTDLLEKGSFNEQKNNCVSENSKLKLKGLQLVTNLDKNNWGGLAYLQKRGSSQANPNPNVISYKFPGSKTKSNGLKPTANLAFTKSTTALLQLKVSNLSKVGTNSVANLNRFLITNVYKLLFIFFKSMYCLISKPVFISTQDKIKIQLFYFVCTSLTSKKRNLISAYYDNQINVGNTSEDLNIIPQKQKVISSEAESKAKLTLARKLALVSAKGSNLTKVYPNKFKLICGILSKSFNKTVELELIRIHKPYYDSTILVNYLALIINKKNIANSIKKLYDSNIIQSPVAGLSTQNLWGGASKALTLSEGKVPNMEVIDLVNNWLGLNDQVEFTSWLNQKAYLAGLNIKISGRLMREAIVPRITTKKFEKGFTANGKVNYSDVARYTHKNRKGAFTITIKSGQKF